MLGRDGAEYLNKVFFQDSQYCVALISENYERRAWTQLERRAAQAREHIAGPGFLLPVLVDATKPPWLLPTRVYFNLPERGLGELATLLQRKHGREQREMFREVGRLNLWPN